MTSKSKERWKKFKVVIGHAVDCDVLVDEQGIPLADESGKVRVRPIGKELTEVLVMRDAVIFCTE